MTIKNVDPRIYLPPVDHEYQEVTADPGIPGPGVVEIPTPIQPGLRPPDSIAVVDQIFRKGADGRTVVDIVIEVEDVPGATEYEVRTSQ